MVSITFGGNYPDLPHDLGMIKAVPTEALAPTNLPGEQNWWRVGSRSATQHFENVCMPYTLEDFLRRKKKTKEKPKV